MRGNLLFSGFSQVLHPWLLSHLASHHPLPINPFPSGLVFFLFPTLLSLSFWLCGLCPRCLVGSTLMSALSPPVHRTGVAEFFCPSSFQISNLSLKVWGAGFPLLIFDTQCPKGHLVLLPYFLSPFFSRPQTGFLSRFSLPSPALSLSCCELVV